MKFILKDWPIKLLSLLVAVMLWVGFNFDDREITRQFNNVTIELRENGSAYRDTGLEVISGKDQMAEIVLYGKKSVINTIDQAQVRAWVDLSSLTEPGSYIGLKVQVTVPYDSVYVERVTPGTVNINVDRIISKRVPVEVRTLGAVQDGYYLDSIKHQPQSVNVVGPSVEVDRVAAARIDISVDGINASSEQTLGYTLVDEDGQSVASDFIDTDIKEITVTTNVLKKKVVPLEVVLNNNNLGDLIQVKITPASIEVAGQEDVIDELETIEIGRVEASLLTEDEEPRSFFINLPQGAKNLSSDTSAMVEFTILSEVSKEISTSNIQIIGLHEGYVAALIDESIGVTVRGLTDDVEAITGNDILVTVDVSAVSESPGTYPALTATITMTTQKQVGHEGMYYVGVVIEEEPPPDDDPTEPDDSQ